jgi:hypothetical protein
MGAFSYFFFLYNREVYSVFLKKHLLTITLLTLVVFVVVMGLHPFAPHHHEFSPIESSSMVAIHTGVADRGFFATTIPIIFFEFFAAPFVAIRFRRALGQRGIQDVDIPLSLTLHTALRVGILNTKSY